MFSFDTESKGQPGLFIATVEFLVFNSLKQTKYTVENQPILLYQGEVPIKEHPRVIDMVIKKKSIKLTPTQKVRITNIINPKFSSNIQYKYEW